MASYVEEEYDIGALVVTCEYKGGGSWVLDSGCSSHMTFNSSFFSMRLVVRYLVLVMLGSLCLMVL